MFRLLQRTFFVLFLSSFVFLTAYAQNTDVVLQLNPQSPRPNATVVVKISAIGTDIDSATITWTVNGKVFKKGKGITSIEVPTGKAGLITRVSATISGSFGTITRQTSFNPVDITLLWESDGYTPPFYKGRALEAYGTKFKVTAIPEFYNSTGKRLDPKTLIYIWKKNGSAVQDQSGYGKDSYSGMQESYVRGEDEISVVVSNQNDDMSGSKAITITPSTPEILFYENNPLIGVIYEHVIPNNINLNQEELTLRAVPFDFSISKINSPSISLDWLVNGVRNTNFSNKNEITIRGAEGGQAVIELNVQHNERILQGGQASVTIFQ